MQEKKKMLKPEMAYIEFDPVDVITTSTPMDGVKGQEGTEGYSGVTPISGDSGIGNPLAPLQ